MSKNSFENALELYQNHAYEESIKIFDDFFSITPSMIESFKNSKSFIFNFKEYRNIISYFNKILEINPDHDIIKKLNGIKDKEDDALKDAAYLLFDQAKMVEGELPLDISLFNKRLSKFMGLALK